MFLSIILTVYNKASFLHRCFNSLLCQKNLTNDDYEIIVVNDGSTDNSLSIILQIKQQNNRIRIINQDNQGLSIARNNGVKASFGDYIWFVDADDTIASDAVSIIFEATKFSPDLIPIYAQTEGENRLRNAVDVKARTGKDVLLGGKWEQCGVFYIFRKSFLLDNGFRFYPGIYHEDAEFTPRVLYAANTIKVIPKVLYTVYRDPNSITQVPKPKRAFDYLIVAERLINFVDTIDHKQDQIKKVLYQNISVDINMAFFVIAQNNTVDEDRLNRVFYEKRRLFINALWLSGLKKFQIEAILFWLLRGKYVQIYKFLKFYT